MQKKEKDKDSFQYEEREEELKIRPRLTILPIAGVRFAAFNLFDISKHVYSNHQVLEEFCQTSGLPMVKAVWRGEFRFTLPELVQLASAQDYAPGQPAEGIVIRPVVEARSRILESGRLSAKVISERYALKHGE